MSNTKIPEYPFIIRHLSKEEGSGYLIEFPDLPGCMSDGETVDEAIENGQDAVHTWIETAKELNRPIPTPGELENQSGKWVQRVPKSIHLRLINRAREEGVSLNTLVIMMLSEALAGESLVHKQFVKHYSTHKNEFPVKKSTRSKS
jgi:antitoxin HicB